MPTLWTSILSARKRFCLRCLSECFYSRAGTGLQHDSEWENSGWYGPSFDWRANSYFVDSLQLELLLDYSRNRVRIIDPLEPEEKPFQPPHILCHGVACHWCPWWRPTGPYAS